MIDLELDELAATQSLARALAGLLAPGDVVALTGALGVGKTALARFLITARAELAGVAPPREVPSPTYTLVQVYDPGPVAVWHFDLYRLERPDDALELAIDEAFAGAISLIEWPDRLGPHLPPARLDIALARAPGEGRRAVIEGRGARGREIEAALTLRLAAGAG